MKRIAFTIAVITALISCSDMKTETIQIGENTFVHQEKVFQNYRQ